MKALVGSDDRILGFTMIGAEAGEVMTVVQTAVLAGLPYPKLRDAVIALRRWRRVSASYSRKCHLARHNGSRRERITMTGKLADKVAVVIGGSSGIGIGIAKRFAQEGARVFITGRRQSELDKAVAAIWRRLLPASVDDPPLP